MLDTDVDFLASATGLVGRKLDLPAPETSLVGTDVEFLARATGLVGRKLAFSAPATGFLDTEVDLLPTATGLLGDKIGLCRRLGPHLPGRAPHQGGVRRRRRIPLSQARFRKRRRGGAV